MGNHEEVVCGDRVEIAVGIFKGLRGTVTNVSGWGRDITVTSENDGGAKNSQWVIGEKVCTDVANVKKLLGAPVTEKTSPYSLGDIVLVTLPRGDILFEEYSGTLMKLTHGPDSEGGWIGKVVKGGKDDRDGCRLRPEEMTLVGPDNKLQGTAVITMSEEAYKNLINIILRSGESFGEIGQSLADAQIRYGLV